MSQYEPYPQGPQEQLPQQRPPAPESIGRAFNLMLAGAGLQAVGVIVTLFQIGAIRKAVRDNATSTTNVDSVVTVTVAATIVFGLIYVGLWLWMAYTNRAGKNWARIVSTVFFALNTLSLLLSIVTVAAGKTMSGGANTALGVIVAAVIWIVALSAIIMLWRRESTDYFTASRTGYAYRPPTA